MKARRIIWAAVVCALASLLVIRYYKLAHSNSSPNGNSDAQGALKTPSRIDDLKGDPHPKPMSVTPSAELTRPVPEILRPTNLRYINHRALTETQQAIQTFRETVVSNGVPENSIAFFEHWANVLCRDALTQRALDSALPAIDRQESVTCMASDGVITNFDFLAKSSLEPGYLKSLELLLVKLSELKIQAVDRATALGTAQEFSRLVKDRQWQSEVFYLSAYKELINDRSISIEKRIAESAPFLALNDPFLTKRVYSHFERLPHHQRLSAVDEALINQFLTSIQGDTQK